MKTLADDKLQATPNNKLHATPSIKFLRASAENIVEKGENAGLHHFLLFPQSFQKASPSCLRDQGSK